MNMITAIFLFAVLAQVVTAHSEYGSVLAEQLNQYCAAQCNSTSHGVAENRVGKAGPQGPQGIAGLRGSVGRRGEIGPQGPIGPPGSVNYTMVDEIVKKHVEKVMTPESCSEVRQLWDTNEGVFDIYSVTLEKRIKLYCDQVTDGGNWTVFQRRMDGSQNFQRNWNEYLRGFGTLYGEFWLGLETLHRLTSQGTYELRIDLGDWEGNMAYARYSTFTVGGAADKYRLRIGGYRGTAGNSLSIHNNMFFSTVDEDNDNRKANCAAVQKGGWWFNACDESNLNGMYRRGGAYSGSADDGVEWHHWKSWYSLKFAEMKFRPKI